MNTILDNILFLIGKKSGAKTKFTKELGFCASTVGDWRSGKSKSYTKHLPKIAAYFNVSVDDLINKDLQKKDIEKAENIIEVGKLYRIPVIGSIRAGLPIIAEEDIEDYEYADIKSPKEYFYLRVRGDSMIGAGINDGSLVLIHKQTYAEDGQIVACLVDGESATLKRIKMKNKNVLLLPENINYEPIVISQREFEDGEAKILGVAVECKTKLI